MSILSEYVAEAAAIPPAQRLEWLIEFGDELPPPNPAAGEVELLPQCQSPVRWAARTVDGIFQVAVQVPASAVLVRGFAGLIVSALDGRPVGEVADAPANLLAELGVAEGISPLRLRGMTALWEHVRDAATPDPQDGN